MFTNKEPDDVSITEAPYGGRLVFVMPESNMLYIHLKDKSLIRNKKRWSQVQNNCRNNSLTLKTTIDYEHNTMCMNFRSCICIICLAGKATLSGTLRGPL